MIYARMEILNNEVLEKCKSKNIEARVLNNSKANCIAFCSNNRKRREFEITFLKDAEYRISTRFTGYMKVLMNENSYIEDVDPDGRRRKYNVTLDTEMAVNKLILKMLDTGFSVDPEVRYVQIKSK